MKRLKTIILICTFALFLSGCEMKEEYSIVISKDKSMNMNVLVAFDEELINGMLSMQEDAKEEYTEEEKWNFIEEMITDGNTNAKKERYQEGNFKGFKIKSDIPNIDSISGKKANASLKDSSDVENSILFEKNEDQYKLVLKKEFDESIEEAIKLNYQSFMNFKFVVTLPDKPISHNANEVSEDGKTLTWNLFDQTEENIEVEFALKDNNQFLIVLGSVGIVAFFVILGMIALFMKRKGKKEIIEEQDTTVMKGENKEEKEKIEDELETIDFSFEE